MDVNAGSSGRAGFVIGLATSHVLVAVLLQLELGVALLMDSAFGRDDIVRFLLWLPWAQFSVLAFAVGVGAVVWLLCRTRQRGTVAIVATAAANLYLCLAQVAFMSRGEYTGFGFTQQFGGMSWNWPLFALNAFIAVAAAAMGPRLLRRTVSYFSANVNRPLIQGVVVLFFAIELLGASLSPYASITVHPAYVQMQSLLLADGSQRAAIRPIWNVGRSGWGERPEPVRISAGSKQAAPTFVLYRLPRNGNMIAAPSGRAFSSVHLLELTSTRAGPAEVVAQITKHIRARSGDSIVVDLTHVSPLAAQALARWAESGEVAELTVPRAELAALSDALKSAASTRVWLIGIPTPRSEAAVASTADVMWRERDSVLAVSVTDPLANKANPARSNTPYGFDQLLAAYFEARPLEATNVFFRTREIPSTWGLRDGRWKYFAGYFGNGARLFDIKRDPFELNNLVADYPERVDYYNRLLASRFTGFAGARRMVGGGDAQPLEAPPARDNQFGPKALRFLGDGHTKTRFAADEVPVLELGLLPYASGTRLASLWAGPAGERLSFDMAISQRWSRYRFDPGMAAPLSPGQWQVVVKQGDRALIGGDFFVSARQSEANSSSENFRLMRRIYAPGGGDFELVATARFAVDDLPRLADRRREFGTELRSVWWPPRGAPVLGAQFYSGERPLALGHWQVDVVDEYGVVLAKLAFDVGARESD